MHSSNIVGDGEAVEAPRSLRAHTVQAEDPGSIPRTHVEQLTITEDSNSRASDVLSWPSKVLACSVYTHSVTHTLSI